VGHGPRVMGVGVLIARRPARATWKCWALRHGGTERQWLQPLLEGKDTFRLPSLDAPSDATISRRRSFAMAMSTHQRPQVVVIRCR
jgi:hypothetical protein